jgi:hypothetical protein
MTKIITQRTRRIAWLRAHPWWLETSTPDLYALTRQWRALGLLSHTSTWRDVGWIRLFAAARGHTTPC